jgi:hypothetical protein
MKKTYVAVIALTLCILLLFTTGCASAPPAETDTAVTDSETAGTEPAKTEAATDAPGESSTEAETEFVPGLPDLSKPLTAEGIRILTFKCPENDYTTAQGCCYDGENWVVAFNKFDQRGEECTLLCKFDKNGKLLKTSDGPLYLEHANNITYIPERFAYFVTSCQGTLSECWNGYSIVDRDSLTLIEKGTLKKPFFAMSYCPERDAYASARWSGETLDFWDGELNHTLTKSVDPPGTLSQGVFAAKDGVWFVRSSRNGYKQEFRVYDWEGELIAAIPLHLKNDAESESVNIINGEFFVTSNAGRRAYLYRVQFSEAG